MDLIKKYSSNFLFCLVCGIVLQFTSTLAWSYCGIFSVQFGAFRAYQGKEQDIAIQGLISDRYTVTQHNDDNILFGLGYYFDTFHNDDFDLLFGLNGFYLSHTVIRGDIIQDPLVNNLNYKYSINSFPLYLLAKTQINFGNYAEYHLTFDLGVGANFIVTSDVQVKNIDTNETLPNHVFSGKTTTTPSATFGLGVSFTPFECGYRFFYLGKGSFQRNTDQVNDTLSTGNGFANAIICAFNM